MKRRFVDSRDIVESLRSVLRQVHSEAMDDATGVLKDYKPPVATDVHAPTARVDVPGHQAGPLEAGGQRHAEGFGGHKFKSVRKFGDGGTNPLFHGETETGEKYMMKPLAGGHETHDPAEWVARNTASNRTLDSMGHSEMGAETFHGHVPHTTQMSSGRIVQPDEHDSPAKVAGMHATHAGMPALVSKFANNTVTANRATPEQLAAIGGHHRLAGIVNHVLMGNADAHGGNVLVNTEKNHPVHIDSDIALNSTHQAAHRADTANNPEGKKAIRSLYSPGNSLDYTKGKIKDPSTGQEREMGQIHHDFPQNIRDTIQKAANGEMSHGLSQADHEHMVSNAQDLLKHGLHNTLTKHRYNVPIKG